MSLLVWLRHDASHALTRPNSKSGNAEKNAWLVLPWQGRAENPAKSARPAALDRAAALQSTENHPDAHTSSARMTNGVWDDRYGVAASRLAAMGTWKPPEPSAAGNCTEEPVVQPPVRDWWLHSAGASTIAATTAPTASTARMPTSWAQACSMEQ